MLDGDCASKGIEILEQLPDPDLVPRIPVLLSQYVIFREVVEDAGPALRRRPREQRRLRGPFALGTVEKPLEDAGSSLPESVGDRGVVHSRPQAEGLSDRRRSVDRVRVRVWVLERGGEGGDDGDWGCGVHWRGGERSTGSREQQER